MTFSVLRERVDQNRGLRSCNVQPLTYRQSACVIDFKGYIRLVAGFACCRRRGGGNSDWSAPVEGALTERTEIEKEGSNMLQPHYRSQGREKHPLLVVGHASESKKRLLSLSPAECPHVYTACD